MGEQVGDDFLDLSRYSTPARDRFVIDHLPHDRELRT